MIILSHENSETFFDSIPTSTSSQDTKMFYDELTSVLPDVEVMKNVL